MKAQDLMIGDWVHFPAGNERVQEIGFVQGVGYYVSFAARLFRVDVDQIEPIPLTAEILQKNSIYLHEVGDNGPATPQRYRNRFEKWIIHTKWRDIWLWYDRTVKEWHLQNMNNAPFIHVHGLQQALRLCKMDKEIVL